jgi:hypothetical protein
VSGPKGLAYRVESVEERERRELRQALDRCAALAQELAALATEATHLGVNVDAVPAPTRGTAEALRQAEVSLRAELTRARSVVEEARVGSRLKAVEHALTSTHAVVLHVDAESEVAEPRHASPVRGPSEDAAGAAVHRSVEHALRALAEVSDEAAVSELTRLASAVLAGSGSSARQALLRLQAAVSTAVRHSRNLRRLEELAREAVVDLGAASDPASDALRARAGQVRDEHDLALLEDEVRALLDLREREADRDFVHAQAVAALEDLGYVVDDGGPATTDGRLAFLAHHAALPHHALELTVVPGRRLLLTHVVALAETTHEEDAAAEESTCADVLSLARTMPAVHAQLVHHRAPGEVAVPRVVQAPRAARRAPAARTRTRRAEPPRHPGEDSR